MTREELIEAILEAELETKFGKGIMSRADKWKAIDRQARKIYKKGRKKGGTPQSVFDKIGALEKERKKA